MAESTKTGVDLANQDASANGRKPVVVVDDLHVKYRVYAGGKPVKGTGRSQLKRSGGGIREVNAHKGVSFTA